MTARAGSPSGLVHISEAALADPMRADAARLVIVQVCGARHNRDEAEFGRNGLWNRRGGRDPHRGAGLCPQQLACPRAVAGRQGL